MTRNTLLLLQSILQKQQLSMTASREEIEAVLDARDQLEAALKDTDE